MLRRLDTACSLNRCLDDEQYGDDGKTYACNGRAWETLLPIEVCKEVVEQNDRATQYRKKECAGQVAERSHDNTEGHGVIKANEDAEFDCWFWGRCFLMAVRAKPMHPARAPVIIKI